MTLTNGIYHLSPFRLSSASQIFKVLLFLVYGEIFYPIFSTGDIEGKLFPQIFYGFLVEMGIGRKTLAWRTRFMLYSIEEGKGWDDCWVWSRDF